ncbi:MAG TPA: ribosome maturation factor RimP [Jiangellaceae bacterium]|jgi:ribosome maturation factor RimP|nr:ribosome maturation factor RimP [Jiangellaceae bacterium]
MGSPSRDLLREIVEPLAAAHGVDLEDVEITPAGRRRRVSVVVDADGGVDLDRCAEVSRAVSAALDESEVMGETPYTLEVSSPGVSRPLTMPRHWRRNVGRLVRLGLRDGGDLVGRIDTADDTGVVLDVDGSARRLAYAAIGAARVQVEFRRTDEVEV